MTSPSGRNKYEVIGKLTETDTSELYVARVAGSAPAKFVVLKRLRRDVAADIEQVRTFLARTRLAMHLDHPNIARVHEVGKLGGSYFSAVEHVDGESMRALIAHARWKKTPLPLRIVLGLAVGAASGLEYAHERRRSDGTSLGIVHGDLTPGSFMVGRDGVVRLVGFGLVPDPRAERSRDLHALGGVLWELITLEPPPSPEDEQIAPSVHRLDVPRELDQVVLKLLFGPPGTRYESAGDVVLALEMVAAKLELPLVANDIARAMRMWFGEQPATQPEAAPVVVETEQVPIDLAAQSGGEVDEWLDGVRTDATGIRAAIAAAAIAPRRARTTIIPTGETERDERESFEQVRDRIMANARPRHESGKLQAVPPIQAAPTPAPDPMELGPAGKTGPTRKKPPTLDPLHQYSYITDVAGKAAGPLRTAESAKIVAGSPEELDEATDLERTPVPTGDEDDYDSADGPDKVVVDLPPMADVKYKSVQMVQRLAEASSRQSSPLAPGEPEAANTLRNMPSRQAIADEMAETELQDPERRAPPAPNPAKEAAERAAERAAVELAAERAAAERVAATAVAAASAVAGTTDRAAAEKAAAKSAADDKLAATKAEALRAETAKADAAKAAAEKLAAAKAAKAQADAPPARAKTDTGGDKAAAAKPAPGGDQAAAAKAAPAAAAPAKPAAARSPWLVPLLAGLVAIAAIAIVAVLHSSKKPAGPPQPIPTASAPADAPRVAVAPPADAAAPVAVVADASEAVAIAPPVDAAAPVTPVDASEVAVAPPVDAAVHVASAPVDAGPHAAPADAAVRVAAHTDAGTPRPRPPSATPDAGEAKPPEDTRSIDELVAAGESSSAVAACQKQALDAAHLATCAAVACKLHYAPMAKHWFDSLGVAARAAVLDKCHEAGVYLERMNPPAPTGDAPPG